MKKLLLIVTLCSSLFISKECLSVDFKFNNLSNNAINIILIDSYQNRWKQTWNGTIETKTQKTLTIPDELILTSNNSFLQFETTTQPEFHHTKDPIQVSFVCSLARLLCLTFGQMIKFKQSDFIQCINDCQFTLKFNFADGDFHSTGMLEIVKLYKNTSDKLELEWYS